ncbi:hypothetical protein PR048_025256 [Dryococelus australis]|uniref:Uncharacterized protein n=1 Tax=Dryococelus australis TaxID=614101 RepID=A0ABQ9GQV3_9NEOP|nr:hypothetical protein PR048_025256 [Dryococelus australis]
MKGRGKWEIPAKNPPTNAIVRHDSHLRKSGDPENLRISRRCETARQFCAYLVARRGDEACDERTWVARSPLPPLPGCHANRARFPEEFLLDFRAWESCKTMPLVGGFYFKDFQFSPSLDSGAALYSPRFTLIGSRDLDHAILCKRFSCEVSISRKFGAHPAWRETCHTTAILAHVTPKHVYCAPQRSLLVHGHQPLGCGVEFTAINRECPIRVDGNTARHARRSDEALGVRVSVARIAPSLLDLKRGLAWNLLKIGGILPTLELLYRCPSFHRTPSPLHPLYGDPCSIPGKVALECSRMGNVTDAIADIPRALKLPRTLHYFDYPSPPGRLEDRTDKYSELTGKEVTSRCLATRTEDEEDRLFVFCACTQHSPTPKAAVAQWLGSWPPTTAIRIVYPAGPLPNFRMWESCWTMPLASWFSLGTPVSPALAFQRRSILGSHVGNDGLLRVPTGKPAAPSCEARHWLQGPRDLLSAVEAAVCVVRTPTAATRPSSGGSAQCVALTAPGICHGATVLALASPPAPFLGLEAPLRTRAPAGAAATTPPPVLLLPRLALRPKAALIVQAMAVSFVFEQLAPSPATSDVYSTDASAEIRNAPGESGESIAAARRDGVVQFCSGSGRERLGKSCSAHAGYRIAAPRLRSRRVPGKVRTCIFVCLDHRARKMKSLNQWQVLRTVACSELFYKGKHRIPCVCGINATGCEVSWCLLSTVHTRRTQQEPATIVEPGGTGCTAATHERVARHPSRMCRCASVPAGREKGWKMYVFCVVKLHGLSGGPYLNLQSPGAMMVDEPLTAPSGRHIPSRASFIKPTPNHATR